VIAARWTRFFFSHEDDEWRDVRTTDQDDPAIVIEEALKSTIEKLANRGIRIVVLGSTPEFDRLLPACLARATWLHWPETRCTFKAGTEPGNPADMLMKKLANENLPARILRPYDALCPGDQCVRRVNSAPIMLDTDHLSTAAAAKVLTTLELESVLFEPKLTSANGPTVLR
jgi:hypothetical protein